MKNHHLVIILLVITQACKSSHSEIEANTFNSSSDTLVINTKKFKGNSLFPDRAGYMSFRDFSEWEEELDWFDFELTYPEKMQNAEIGLSGIMLKPIRFYDKQGSDTIQLNTSRSENIRCIAKGKTNNKEIFIIDENNNKDFRDDSIRTFQKWNWRSDDSLITYRFTLDLENSSHQDSGWIKIGQSEGSYLFSTCEHHEGEFSIDGIQYTIGIVDENSSSFCYFKPAFALIEENGLQRDTLYKNDILAKNEYIKLGNSYYQINDFYPGSGTIILTKEKNFESLTGTQLGAQAPHFTAQTLSGDTIQSTKLNTEYLLIANMSGCTPRSYDEYGKMIQKLNGKMTIIGMEYKVPENLGGLLVEIEKDVNQDFYQKYRNAYSSYDCYLIDKDYRIADKFSLFDWETHLTQYIEH